MSRRKKKRAAPTGTAPDVPDRDLIRGMRVSGQLLDRSKSLIVGICGMEETPFGEFPTLEYVDENQWVEEDGSYLIVDEEREAIISTVQYADSVKEFEVPDGKEMIFRRRYVLFRMGRA